MYREVPMFEVKEALRLWLSGTPKKRIAAQLGLDPKTVRHYVAVGAGVWLQLGAVLTEEHIRDVLLALQPSGGRPRGDTWSHCVAQREAIARWLRQGVRLSKIRKLLARTGVSIPYLQRHQSGKLHGDWPNARRWNRLIGRIGHKYTWPDDSMQKIGDGLAKQIAAAEAAAATAAVP
jgi:DNA-binding transcriptional MerR regulator